MDIILLCRADNWPGPQLISAHGILATVKTPIITDDVSLETLGICWQVGTHQPPCWGGLSHWTPQSTTKPFAWPPDLVELHGQVQSREHVANLPVEQGCNIPTRNMWGIGQGWVPFQGLNLQQPAMDTIMSWVSSNKNGVQWYAPNKSTGKSVNPHLTIKKLPFSAGELPKKPPEWSGSLHHEVNDTSWKPRCSTLETSQGSQIWSDGGDKHRITQI